MPNPQVQTHFTTTPKKSHTELARRLASSNRKEREESKDLIIFALFAAFAVLLTLLPHAAQQPLQILRLREAQQHGMVRPLRQPSDDLHLSPGIDGRSEHDLLKQIGGDDA